MLLAEAHLIANRASSARTLVQALAVLREMPLDDFGMLLLEPEQYPKLQPLLPSMASAAAQEQWAGASGTTLLGQSVSVMRSLESLHARHRGSSLHGKRILDFGCGWGRLLRLALYYSDPEFLHGVDPWDESIRLCREHRVPGEILQCDYLPVRLPTSSPFDVAFAFSVFTHLSERAMLCALRALRSSAAPGGTLFFSIRPVEYWHHHQQFHARSRDQMFDEHAKRGFAYQPHGNIVVDGEATYGDTSMTHAFAREALRQTGWKWLGADRSMIDPFQTLIAASAE